MTHRVKNRLSRGGRGPAARAAAVLLLALLALAPGLTLAQEPPAQEPAPAGEAPPAGEEQTSVVEESVDPFSELDLPDSGSCPEPSTQEQILIGALTLVLAAICYFLLVRLMERRFIVQDRSALLGRHLGFSLTIFMSSLGFVALVYLITGCVHSKFWLWLAFAAALWILHGIYTLVVVRD